MKKVVSSILILSMLSLPVIGAGAADKISVTLDGKELSFDNEPRIINGRVMVPMRKMFEAIDAKISWDGEASAATAVKEAQYIKFTDSKGTMEVGVCKDGKDDGELLYYADRPLDSEAVIIDGTMYVPMRILAETFHYDVNWNADKNRAEITSPEETDEVIYYSSWTDGGHMYRADANGQNRRILSTDDCYSERWNFGYGSGCIFYSIRDHENPENEGALYMIKNDGTGKKKLTDNPVNILYNSKGERSSYGADEDGNLFFIEGERDKSGYFSPYNGTVYLYKLNTETGETTQLVDEPVQPYPQLYGDYIYFQYISDSIDKMFSYYRVDKDGGEIIKVTGDIVTNSLRFDIENDRLLFSSYYRSGSYKSYSAALDGSDIQQREDERDSKREAREYGLDYIIRRGDGYVIGIKEDSYNTYYVIDEDGNELSKIEEPENMSMNIYPVGDKLYYNIYPEHDYGPKTIYVDSIEEIMGMNYISVGKEKVDGKYEITGVYDYDYDYRMPYDKNEIHVVNLDGSDDKLLLTGYYLAYVDDEEQLLRLMKHDGNDDDIKVYTADLDGGNLTEYKYQEDLPVPLLNEDVHYGIVVKADGTVESYRGNNW